MKNNEFLRVASKSPQKEGEVAICPSHIHNLSRDNIDHIKDMAIAEHRQNILEAKIELTELIRRETGNTIEKATLCQDRMTSFKTNLQLSSISSKLNECIDINGINNVVDHFIQETKNKYIKTPTRKHRNQVSGVENTDMDQPVYIYIYIYIIIRTQIENRMSMPKTKKFFNYYRNMGIKI